MKRIDAHQHFWQYNPRHHSWMNDQMDVLKNDFGPELLAPLLKKHQLDGCIAVQAAQTEEENDYLLSLADAAGIIEAVVGWADLRSPGIAEQLAYYRSFRKMKGFRHIIQDEPDTDFMLRPDFLNGIKELGRAGYTYDILIYARHLDNTEKFLSHFPDQLFVVDHIAKPDILQGSIEEWKAGLSKVAAFPNVYCKVSGMVTEAGWKQWSLNDFTPYLDAVTELFGMERLMYGSDWPVCLLSASYEETFRIVSDYYGRFSAAEQDAFFGGNACRFYGIE